MSARGASFIARPGAFRAVVLLGLVLGALGLACVGVLAAHVLVPFASACLQACADNPALMAFLQGVASLSVALIVGGVAAGIVGLGAQLVATARLLKRIEMRAAIPPSWVSSLAFESGLGNRLTYVEEPAPFAFCYGFLRPRVCLSSGMAMAMSDDELRAVLLHEGFHALMRDPLKVLASRLVAGGLFLVPLAAELRDRYLVEKELAADEYVVRALSARPLASALLKLCRSGKSRLVADLAAAAVGPFDVVRERIRHLAGTATRPAPPRLSRIAVSFTVVAFVLVATVGSAYAAERGLGLSKPCCASSVTCPISQQGQP